LATAGLRELFNSTTNPVIVTDKSVFAVYLSNLIIEPDNRRAAMTDNAQFGGGLWLNIGVRRFAALRLPGLAFFGEQFLLCFRHDDCLSFALALLVLWISAEQ
jgi:hypothetical protein